MLNQVRTWATAAGAAVLCASVASAQFTDDFESYPASAGGTVFTPGGAPNSGGWRQWDSAVNSDTLCYGAGGPVAAHSGSKFIATQLGSDTIHPLSTFTAGQWVIRAWTYVPSTMQDIQWFVLLNDYNDFGPYQWATQIVFDPVIGEVRADNGYSHVTCTPQWGLSVPLTFDAWKETKVEVDLDADVAQIYYDGNPIGDPFTWSQGPFGQNGGAGLPCPAPPFIEKSIECIDLYANSTVLAPSFIYWDDISVTAGGSTPPPLAYCTPSGSGSSSGCVTAISATANPDIAHSNTCQITVSGVEGQKNGIIFYGLGANALPWCTSGGNSMLCVKSPTQRTQGQISGGTAGQCNGSLNLNWNAFQLANPGSLGNPWSAGTKAYVQGWFRDPASCKTTFLSQALEMTYAP